MVCIGDIHLSHTNPPHFEKLRMAQLSEHINKTYPNAPVALLGDTFDTNNPKLQTIKLFYEFIENLGQRDIHIIAGNHDPTVFKYLPEFGFKYYDTPTVVSGMVFIGHPWISAIPHYEGKGLILMSHLRCNLGFADEEYSFDNISKGYTTAILGDIHKPVKGLPKNIYYTLEPTNNSFTSYNKTSCGYLFFDGSVKREHPELAHKDLHVYKSTTDYMENFDKYTSGQQNLYKVRIEDYIPEFGKINRTINCTYEFIPKIEIVDEEEATKELREIIEQKVSISEVLLEFTKNNYNFDLEVYNRVRGRLAIG